MELALEIAVGLVVGAVMGALGGGGGVIAVPALVYLLGQPPAVATTTSLVIVGITGVAAVAQHARTGRVRWVDGSAFGVLGAGGALLGSRVGAVADPRWTMGLLAGLLLLTAWAMWRGAREQPGADAGPGEPWIRWRPLAVRPRRALVILAVASGVGVLTGFFGVGGGFAIVPALTLVMGLPMTYVVGTSLLVVTINSALGLAGRLGSDLKLDWGLVAVFTASAVAGSLVGGRIGTRLDPSRAQRAFAVMLLLVAAWTALRTARA